MTDPLEGAPSRAPVNEPSAGVAGAEFTHVPPPEASAATAPRPTFVFFGIVSGLSLLLDVTTKAWAEITLSARAMTSDPSPELIKDHLSFALAYNKGGAWGLFQDHPEYIRRPFFLLVSLLAVTFIINLYGRLAPGQRALKWGLPLVLGGALGNLADRIVRSNVIDFIDYRAQWIESMNRLMAKVNKGWIVTDHWPTFNVADIAICVGVGLMAVDMFTSRRGASGSLPPKAANDAVSPATGVNAQDASSAPKGGPEATPPLKPEA